jgi:hypothetical protein
MTLYGGQNSGAEKTVEIEPIALGIGRVACPECGGKPEEYSSLFPPEIGVTECVDCIGLGYIYADI